MDLILRVSSAGSFISRLINLANYNFNYKIDRIVGIYTYSFKKGFSNVTLSKFKKRGCEDSTLLLQVLIS